MSVQVCVCASVLRMRVCRCWCVRRELCVCVLLSVVSVCVCGRRGGRGFKGWLPERGVHTVLDALDVRVLTEM